MPRLPGRGHSSTLACPSARAAVRPGSAPTASGSRIRCRVRAWTARSPPIRARIATASSRVDGMLRLFRFRSACARSAASSAWLVRDQKLSTNAIMPSASSSRMSVPSRRASASASSSSAPTSSCLPCHRCVLACASSTAARSPGMAGGFASASSHLPRRRLAAASTASISNAFWPRMSRTRSQVPSRSGSVRACAGCHAWSRVSSLAAASGSAKTAAITNPAMTASADRSASVSPKAASGFSPSSSRISGTSSRSPTPGQVLPAHERVR